MVTKKGWICIVFLALLMAGCAQERHAAADVSHFTIALQCGNATPLPLKVVGDIQMDVREFMFRASPWGGHGWCAVTV